MHFVSCTNTHRDVTDLVNHGMVKNTKTWISWEWNIFFYEIKKFLICASDGTIWEVIVQNGQQTIADEWFECIWPFCGVGA